MAKIGTAHVEIKPVVNEEALEALAKRIEDAIVEGVARALASQQTTVTLSYEAPARLTYPPSPDSPYAR